MTSELVVAEPGSTGRAPLISARGLTKTFPLRGGTLGRVVGGVRAVDHVDLDIFEGEMPMTILYNPVAAYAMKSTVKWQPYSQFYMDFVPANFSLAGE